MDNIGKLIIGVGILLIIVGVLIGTLGEKLNWFGNLPGDIKIEKENFRIYIPFVSMLIVSILLSVLFWIVNKFLK